MAGTAATCGYATPGSRRVVVSPVSRIGRQWARFVGPEATRFNHALAIGSAIAGAVAAGLWARRRGGGLGTVGLVAVMAADLVGGAYVNNTRACVRWYERAGQGDREHLAFAALHAHPVLVAWVDRRLGAREHALAWAVAQYGYMMVATVIIRSCPVRRRILGVALTAGGVALDRTLGPSTSVPWFSWTYYPKLLMGHAAGSFRPDEDFGADFAHLEGVRKPWPTRSAVSQ